MTEKDFYQSVTNGKSDVVQMLLDILDETGTPYCVIGGLAVNAYVEPVVSLDIDIIVAVEMVEAISAAAEKSGLTLRSFEHSLNLASPHSDLRIQIQTDPRYQDFIPRATVKEVLGYPMKVADLKDVLQGKVWAYLDKTRRKSKRQKDLADIMRLVEAYPKMEDFLPSDLKEEMSTD